MTLTGLKIAAKVIGAYKSNLNGVLAKANGLISAVKEEALDVLNADVFLDHLQLLTDAKPNLSREAEEVGKKLSSWTKDATEKAGAAIHKGRATVTQAVAASVKRIKTQCRTIFAAVWSSKVFYPARIYLFALKKVVSYVAGNWHLALATAGLAGMLAIMPVTQASSMAKRILTHDLAILGVVVAAYWACSTAASLPLLWRQAVKGKEDLSLLPVQQNSGYEHQDLEVFDCIAPQEPPFLVSVSQLVLTDLDAVAAMTIAAVTPVGELLVEAVIVFDQPIPFSEL